ncbi:MAG: hypothetical protein E6Q77_01855 [Rhizobium sp.]|nr:MAG: hypothetical protein E6Q77_01855 [Rhizobium sp.]
MVEAPQGMKAEKFMRQFNSGGTTTPLLGLAQVRKDFMSTRPVTASGWASPLSRRGLLLVNLAGLPRLNRWFLRAVGKEPRKIGHRTPIFAR